MVFFAVILAVYIKVPLICLQESNVIIIEQQKRGDKKSRALWESKVSEIQVYSNFCATQLWLR